MAINYNPRIVTDGFVLCLDAANPKSYPGSGTTWTDLSGNGNNGNISSSAEFIQTNLGVLYRSTDVATIAPQTAGLSLSNETYTFWAKCMIDRTTVGGGSFNNWVIHYGNYFGNNSGGFGLQSGGFTFFLKGSTSSGWSANGGSGVANTIYDTYDWIHYALQITNSNNIKFYMNNILIFNRTISDAYTQHGSNTIVFGRNMQMSLSNIQAYNRVLTPQEIQQNYNATKSRYLP